MFHRDFLNNLFFGGIIKKWARWKLSLSSPSWPSLYCTLLVLLIIGGLQEGDRSVPVPPVPCRGAPEPSLPGDRVGPPLAPKLQGSCQPKWRHPVCRKTSDGCRRVARASKPQPLRGADNSLRCACSSSVPAGGAARGKIKKKTKRQKNECHCHFPVSRFLALPFLAVRFWNIFSVALSFFPSL